ncbi:MAG TPA: preprotein translocase subunit SecA, partial [Planctomycetes bacterium]|nr:preprotein translocase subunit SecA [Planctomycetota bacterium]
MKLDFGSLPSRIGKALQGVFGSANKRSLAIYNPLVQSVNDLSDWAKDLSQDQIQAEIAEMKKQVQADELTLDDALAKVFAMTREASWRTLSLRHFDVQLIGGAVLHHGKIAE